MKLISCRTPLLDIHAFEAHKPYTLDLEPWPNPPRNAFNPTLSLVLSPRRRYGAYPSRKSRLCFPLLLSSHANCALNWCLLAIIDACSPGGGDGIDL
jgi:hypothetical protein